MMKSVVAQTLSLAVIAMITIHADTRGDDVASRFEAQTMPYGDGAKLPYRVLKPSKVDAGKKYPLLIFLHGAGERGDDNTRQLKYLPAWFSEAKMRDAFPCYFIAPQCPRDHRWGSLDWRKKMKRYTKEPVPEAAAVLAIINKAMKEYPIDASRVYLTGLSMGGYGTWELASRHPDLFAAIAPICGAGDPSKAKKLVDIPTWIWHGDKDGAVPVDRSREMVAAIKAAGGNPKYTELPGVGHNSWTPAYNNPDGVVQWLFKQVKD